MTLMFALLAAAATTADDPVTVWERFLAPIAAAVVTGIGTFLATRGKNRSSSLVDISTAFSTLTKDLQEALDRSDKQVASLTNQMGAMQRQLTATQTALANTQQQLVRAEKALVTERTARQALTRDLNAARDEIARLRGEIATQHGDVS